MGEKENSPTLRRGESSQERSGGRRSEKRLTDWGKKSSTAESVKKGLPGRKRGLGTGAGRLDPPKGGEEKEEGYSGRKEEFP